MASGGRVILLLRNPSRTSGLIVCRPDPTADKRIVIQHFHYIDFIGWPRMSPIMESLLPKSLHASHRLQALPVRGVLIRSTNGEADGFAHENTVEPGEVRTLMSTFTQRHVTDPPGNQKINFFRTVELNVYCVLSLRSGHVRSKFPQSCTARWPCTPRTTRKHASFTAVQALSCMTAALEPEPVRQAG